MHDADPTSADANVPTMLALIEVAAYAWWVDPSAVVPVPVLVVARGTDVATVTPLLGPARGDAQVVPASSVVRTYRAALRSRGIPLTLDGADGVCTPARAAFRALVVDAICAAPSRQRLPGWCAAAIAEAWYVTCDHPIAAARCWSLRQLGALLTDHERRWVQAAVWRTVPPAPAPTSLDARIDAHATAARLDDDAREDLWSTVVADACRDVPPPPPAPFTP